MKTSPRVLVTRSAHQASPLAEALRARGIEPVLVPTIEIASPASYCALDAALACLPTYHWLIFTSANAVAAFFQRLRTQNFAVLSGAKDLLFPTPCRIAAIGPATARAVTELTGTKPDLIPPHAVAESLAAALLPYALQPDGGPTRFLLPRAQDARNVLETQLTAAGADVTIAPVYRNVIPPKSIQAIKDLFSTPANYPDAITFTSSSAATNLLALLEAAGLTLPPQVLRVSIGPITSETLRDHHLPPHAEASTSTVLSLVEKVVEALEVPHYSLKEHV